MQKVSPKFDEIKIGDAVVERIEITEGLVDRYITLSGDSSEIHQCLEAAHDAGFLGRVVHGTLISSFFSMLIGTRLPGHNALLLEIKCKFQKKQVKSNSRENGEREKCSRKEMGKRKEMKLTEIEKENMMT